MAVLASIKINMVVKKRDASSFHDVKLAAVLQVKCACKGWGGKRETNRLKIVTGVTLCGLAGFLRWAWETWVYVFRSDYSHRTKRNEKVNILHASLCKAKRV